MSASRARRCATPLSAAVCALALIAVRGSGQAPPSARAQVVWHWFGGCAGTDTREPESQYRGSELNSARRLARETRRAAMPLEPRQAVPTGHVDWVLPRSGP